MKVLVTGASAGIGRATAELFLERGHEVWGFDVQAATLTHPGYTHHVVDVRHPQDFPAGIKPEIIIVLKILITKELLKLLILLFLVMINC